MPDLMKALRHPRRAVLYALLGRERYRRFMADADASARADWLGREIASTDDTVTRFHLLSFYGGALQQTYWLGVPIQKSPLDCWVYQELIYDLHPDLIIETGTDLGGSALFLASICDLVGHGRVVSIDVRSAARVTHPRITFLLGDSTSAEILEQVRGIAADTERVLVILDSDHHATHVGRELRAYREFVSKGSYLVVEDTNVNGHPVMPEHGPGPYEAVEEFLREDSQFQVDRSREKFLMTYFPNGFLKRVAVGETKPGRDARSTSQ
ncbi:MAG: CmcI family methyltransferase [Gaiellales bacterium]